jgi:amino acid adenylation domain-containing protein
MSEATDVAIIGMSCRFPGANTVEQYWQNLIAGRETVSTFTKEELNEAGVPAELIRDPNYVNARGVIEGAELFDANFFNFTPREAEITDPQHRILLECAWEALENAGQVPGHFEGLVGVFSGAGTNHYAANIISNPQIRDMVSDLQIGIGTEPDFLANRVAYKLNMKGPAVVVQTACSTGLVAVHLACLSLLNYECDTALAGAISIRLPQTRGYLYQEGGILSPDGRCRAFDAGANGTVSSNGAGMVILKRLTDAVADQDQILAVIKGSAINNDGSAKMGYTAPSVDGQAKVIASAQAMAGVGPGEITYIEAHGTGTNLGDPIEFAALKQVFRNLSQPANACHLGSVKTNIGHLNTAAGMAGLIKTVLALKNNKIPPTLHFENPNPEINLTSSPFRINTELIDWDTDGIPRQAGVSSFGLGGTNAHVILEEAPEPKVSQAARPWQIITLSGKTRNALETSTNDLINHLQTHQEMSIADIAFTYQTGRKVFPHRRIMVCRHRQDALETLNEHANGKIFGQQTKIDKRSVTFMFPGIGDQYVNMAKGLYKSEPTFRYHFDHCIDILNPQIQMDLGEVLYPQNDGENPAENTAEEFDLREMLSLDGSPPDKATENLNQPHYIQPILFIVEYALAQLLMEWGIRPKAMIGHSLGEFVAATIAGVFSLEDALHIVNQRAQLIQSLPSGSMLAVQLTEEEIQPYLENGISIALVNAPTILVLAGSDQAINNLERNLSAGGILYQRIRNSHPIHTSAMESIVGPLNRIVEGTTLQPPKIPFISNVSGTWITDTEATDPSYWGKQLCQPVRFADGMQRILENHDQLLLEVGPGQTLSVLARQHPDSDHLPAPVALSCIRHSYDKRMDDIAFLLTTVGRLWLVGIEIDWIGFHTHGKYQRVPLPTYPFERQRYWIEPHPPWGTRGPIDASPRIPDKKFDEEQPITNGGDTGLKRPERGTEHTPSSDQLEKQITKIWEMVLGIKGVGMKDSFLELGGHSLLAIQLASRISQQLNIDFPISDLLEANTINAQANRARQILAVRGMQDKAPFQLPHALADPINRHIPFPLTDIQQAYWVGRNQGFDLGNIATHGYFEIETQTLDLERFNQAWQRVIERHDMLRAVVLPDGQQQILESVPEFKIELIDLREQPSDAIEKEIEAIRERMSHQIFPLDKWPLFEIIATRKDKNTHHLHISFDLIIGDAWSWQILFSEIITLYQNPDTTLEPLGLSFRDYVVAEQEIRKSELYERSLRYWRRQLETLPPGPELPNRHREYPHERPRFRRISGVLSADAWRRLKDRAALENVTHAGILLTAFSETLAIWSKKPRFTLNLTLFNRLPLHPKVNEIIGDFTSLTLLSVDIQPEKRFGEKAHKIQNQLWKNLDHRYVSGVEVMREYYRLQGGKPRVTMPVVFTSTLNMHTPGQDTSSLATTVAKLGKIVFGIAQTPQIWLDHQVYEDQGKLIFNWDILEGIFPEGMVEAMFEAYTSLLQLLADDEGYWQSYRSDLVPSLIPQSQLDLQDSTNENGAQIPKVLLHTPFIDNVSRQPDHPAIITSSLRLTYQELFGHAAFIGSNLLQLGALPNTLMAVVMEKGWEQVAAVLGVLFSGAAYLPIDADLPMDRIHYLLEQGQVKIALTQAHLEAEIDWPEGIRRVIVDQSKPPEQDPMQMSVQEPGDLAYVIFTSGSTGMPKGVMIDHNAAANTIVDINQRFHINNQDKVLALSSLSFDLSVYDIFGTLAAGGTIVMPDSSGVQDPAHWAALIDDEQVSIWNSVPILMELMVEYLELQKRAFPDSTRIVLLSGDWIPVPLPDRIKKLVKNAEIISLGGATEASIWSIFYPIQTTSPTWKSIPYGKPLSNQQFYVLDEHLDRRPTWVSGGLYIGGGGLAIGYWRDENETTASFIYHPRTGERLYKTGDLGRYLPDGDIEFLGREDQQIKIQGYRVELAEIETAIRQCPGVSAAAVSTLDQDNRETQLAGYVVRQESSSLTIPELRSYLHTKLPTYMVPSTMIFISELPLTPNGKVDRKVLPSLIDGQGILTKPTVTKDYGQVAQMSQLVMGILQITSSDPHSDIIYLGATSVDMIRIINQVETEFGFRPQIDEFYDNPTIAWLVESYQNNQQHKDNINEIPEWLTSQESISSSFELILDPIERDNFRNQQLGLRPDESEKASIELLSGENNDADIRRFIQRRSYRQFRLNPIPLEDFGSMLSCLRQININGHPKYRYPSAGGLYPVQTYLYVKPGRVDGMAAGIYYYHPQKHQLTNISPDARLDRAAYSRLINRPIFDEAAFAIYFIAQIKAIAPMYADHSMPYCLLEAGYMSQLLMEESPQFNIGLCAIGDLDFHSIRSLFQLEDTHTMVHSLLGGRIDARQMETLENEQSVDASGEENLYRIIKRVKDLSESEVKKLLDANDPDDHLGGA